MKTIICDIDGVIADCTHRLHYIQDEKGNKLPNPDWNKFYSEVLNDKPIKKIIDLLEQLNYEYLNESYSIIFLTGRNENCIIATKQWLFKNVFIPYECLLMRKEYDYRPYTQVKPDLLKKYLAENQTTEIAFILEDQEDMVEKWKELGYTVLQVK